MPLAKIVCCFLMKHGKVVYIGRNREQPGLRARLIESIFRPSDRTEFSDEAEWERYKETLEARRQGWSEEMRPAFDQAVSTGQVVLYARKRAQFAPFERLTSNVWPNLKVINWQEGNAITPNGAKLFAIHGSKRSGLKPGRKPKIDWENIIWPFAFEICRQEFAKHGNFRRGFQARLELLVMDKIEAEIGEPCSLSVVREHTSRFISEFKSQKAGN